ncbi:hypothetical protein ARALYDRAFT_894748 [Arabidopsis lyrata subsp. lyrata]|uniref:F-box domain-containing protein n=1 Tax=Arabidopsis lyrata subsp. lyrata TaxID=81972 RepID=D7KXH6_ARALL|nr:hypothetical protein ARALYDRAFT_894748 [Arabidopsis lyrata subsp. lyrata]
MTILMLPDDVVLNCLARVSRLYYPTLSLVSKKFRSLLSSKELYQTRTLLGRTESFLYVFLRRRPNSSKRILVPISSPNFPSARWSKVAAVGPNIYSIGGLEHNMSSKASSNVMAMDCRSHTWCEAPSMHVAREFHSVCAFDGKIYVTGANENLDSTNWMGVFDTNTRTWEYLQIPGKELCRASQLESVWYEGTLYVRSEKKNVTYKLHKGRWRKVDYAMNYGWGRSSSYCVIENVFYHNFGTTIYWFDSQKRSWKILKGLESLCKSLCNKSAKYLVDYGGKIAVLWQDYVSLKFPRETSIWCAEIAIEKRENGEIWGMLEWVDIVFTTDNPSNLVHALTTTV